MSEQKITISTDLTLHNDFKCGDIITIMTGEKDERFWIILLCWILRCKKPLKKIKGTIIKIESIYFDINPKESIDD